MSNDYLDSQEFNTNPYESASTLRGLETENSLFDALLSLARWQIFLCALGFMVIGVALLIVLIALFLGGSGRWFFTMDVCFVAFVIYTVPAIFLLRASRAIREFATKRTGTLTLAIEAQRSFWRMMVVIACFVLGLYVTAVVAGAFVGVSISGISF